MNIIFWCGGTIRSNNRRPNAANYDLTKLPPLPSSCEYTDVQMREAIYSFGTYLRAVRDALLMSSGIKFSFIVQ